MQHAHEPKNAFHLRTSSDDKYTYRPRERKRLFLSMIITAVMMVVEFIGGIIIGSLALVSDAGHMFTHFLALSVSLGAILLAGRRSSSKHSYGFYRIEVLAALFNGSTLLIITFYIFYEGIIRIINPRPIHEFSMIVIAFLGLVVNIISALLLKGVSTEDLNVRSAFLHMVADTASSVAILAGAIAIHYTKFLVIDPILSIIIAFAILVWGYDLVRNSVNILLERAPEHINIEELSMDIRRSNPDIKHIHDIHVWTITSGMYAMTAHIIIDDRLISETDAISQKIRDLLNTKYDINHATLQFETDSRSCLSC